MSVQDPRFWPNNPPESALEATAARADAKYLWDELAELRYEVFGAVAWIRGDAEPSIALARLDKAADKALVALRSLEGVYAGG